MIDDKNETEQERSSSRVSQTVEEWSVTEKKRSVDVATKQLRIA